MSQQVIELFDTIVNNIIAQDVAYSREKYHAGKAYDKSSILQATYTNRREFLKLVKCQIWQLKYNVVLPGEKGYARYLARQVSYDQAASIS